MTLDPAAFHEIWVKAVATGTSLNPVTEGSGNVFCVDRCLLRKQLLFALDISTGSQKWSYDFGSIFAVDPPGYSNGVVYVATGGHGDTFMWEFDASAGTLRAGQLRCSMGALVRVTEPS